MTPEDMERPHHDPSHIKSAFGTSGVCATVVALHLATAMLTTRAEPDSSPSTPPARKLAVTWNDAKGDSGQMDLLNPEAPWTFSGNPLETGRNAVLRVKGGRIYAVCPNQDAVKVMTLDPWTLERTYPLPRATEPVDIAVANSQVAYVTGRNATRLLRLDLVSGATEEILDFGPFADSDGIPDLGDMALFEGRLLVQIRRLNQDDFRGYTPPAYLAVVDTATESLLDMDPALPGIQAIALAGTFPKRPMQIIRSLRRLFLSATGGFFDAGGIEMIDLDCMHSLGLVVRESDGLTGADLGPFYLIDPARAFLVFTTDLTISSHMVGFSLLSGVSDVPLHTEVDFLAPVLEYDSISDSLFFPSSGYVNPGIHVFQGATGERLTMDPISTDGPPWDMVMVGDSPDGSDPASLEIGLHPGLLITGTIGATYQIQYALELPGSNWMTLTNLSLRESPLLWCDPAAVTQQPRRYYRAVLVE